MFTLCIMFRKGISFIYEKFYCGDRVPLKAVMTLFGVSSICITFAFQDARVVITNMTIMAVMVITPVMQWPYLF